MMRKIFIVLFMLFTFLANANDIACSSDKNISPESLGNGGGKIKIQINYPNHDDCSFSTSPVNFCDDRHTAIINKAFKEQSPNFFKYYILISIPERVKYHQRSIVAINSLNGEVYPVPIDSYSGRNSVEDGKVNFNLTSNELCIEGDILVYRAIKSGYFCFSLEGDKFTGYPTTYME
jgi:hypothetical protein